VLVPSPLPAVVKRITQRRRRPAEIEPPANPG
jgi:hypothetical protein